MTDEKEKSIEEKKKELEELETRRKEIESELGEYSSSEGSLKKETKEEKKQREDKERAQRKEARNKGHKDHLYEGKNGSWTPIVIIMLVSILIAALWHEIPAIKNAIHFVLDPTAGSLLDWNLNWGMLILALVISLITTLVQKYATDQETLKEIKQEQKDLQKEMKENKDNPEKMKELQKKNFKLMPNQMKLSMRAIAFTGVPFILLIRWFEDYFGALQNYDLWLGMGWFLFYLIALVVIGAILRKQLDVV